ncbi:lasso peptide biosynthesis B2 protein [Brevundimonas sp.]
MTLQTSVTCVLADAIHLAWCGDDVVILDLDRDQYGLLVDARPLLAPGPVPGTISIDPEVRDDIEALGLAATGFLSEPRLPLPAQTGDMPGGPHAVGLWAGLRAATDSLVSTTTFHGRPLGHLVAAARRRRTSTGPSSLAPLARAVGAFGAVHPWIPFEGDCLQRGYRLHHHLHCRGFDARWVFGVRTWPFLAHCWVQVGDLVVGDSLDRVGGFTPIMAV